MNTPRFIRTEAIRAPTLIALTEAINFYLRRHPGYSLVQVMPHHEDVYWVFYHSDEHSHAAT